MPREADRVAEISTSTGTGSMTLSSAVGGHRTWAAAFGASNTPVDYGIVHDGAGTWEVGIGTFLPGSNAIQRDLVLASSDGGSKVAFAAGDKIVYCQQPAEVPIQIRIRRSADVGLDIIPAASQSAPMIRVQTGVGDDAFIVSPTGKITTANGIAFSGATAATPNDLSRHIDLYSGIYGFNVNGGRLNYNANSNHDFYSGGVLAGTIYPAGATVTNQNAFLTAQKGDARYIASSNGPIAKTGSQTIDGRLNIRGNNANIALRVYDHNENDLFYVSVTGGLRSFKSVQFDDDLNVSGNLKVAGTRLLVGGPSYTGLDSDQIGASIQGPGAGNPGGISSTVSGAGAMFLNRLASDGGILAFYRQSNFIASISVTTTAVSYNTTSDARRKENARDFDSGAMIDALPMQEFDWKAKYGGGTAYGALVDAETAAIFPTAFGYDAEHDLWSADYSKLVPVLWREVHCLRGRMADLEAQAG